MADNDNGATAATAGADDKKRFRSEIEFPYADLQSAVELGHWQSFSIDREKSGCS